jgi:hypothetical protein
VKQVPKVNKFELVDLTKTMFIKGTIFNSILKIIEETGIDAK